MKGGASKETVKNLRTLFRLGAVGDLDDGHLLDRFVGRRDESAELAFAILVDRHGPMVMGVCRRVLNNSHEAEDAFQATFLILARKAATIMRRHSLASWLYGVALRTAKDARGRAARRRTWEGQAVLSDPDDPADIAANHELHSILTEELDRLPERYRMPVLLCELEGLPRQEASRRLGIPEGTLSSRLARARLMLRDRFFSRGLFGTTVCLTSLMESEARALAVPFALAESVTSVATRVAAGFSLAGLVPGSVKSLTEEVLSTMMYAKIKGIALGALTLGAAVTGAVLAQQPSPAPRPAGPGTGAFVVTQDSVGMDRLRAVELKLDRILEAIGTRRNKDSGMEPSSTTATTSTSTLGALDDVRATGPTPVPAVRADPFSTTPTAATSPIRSADRLSLLERRLADVEQRLSQIERTIQIERRIDATPRPSTVEPPPAHVGASPPAPAATRPSPF
jgi:RNA polymerase sigma factor (sigma-70 family)